MARKSHNSFCLPRVRQSIKPFRLHFYPRLRSTNDHAATLRKKNQLFAPAIILTPHQIAGRGRGSNTWWSDSGTLTVTFVLPAEEHLAPHQIPLAAGLATRNAAAALSGDPSISLKWPNDVLYGGRKLAGLLCERIQGVDLIGIGLNINTDPANAPRHLRRRITSLMCICGRSFDLGDVLIALTSHLSTMLLRRTNHPFAAILHDYDRHHSLVGRKVEVSFANDEAPVRGRCEGLDSSGRLMVRKGRSLHRIIAGHVQTM